jgi:hypothetical protein
MALKKQSIRTGMDILVNEDRISKEELIIISESWDERQERFFRKMLKQGGEFKIKGIKYKISLKERSDLNSQGEKPINLPPISGERSF